jgi:exopolyphosphatase/guanosine-5'-triphosphate,3'-diphosphate pyrophosphatase
LRFFADGKLGKTQFRDAILAARNEIQRIRSTFRPEEWQLAVGTSGTARSLRDILEINDYSTADITREGLDSLYQELLRRGQIKNLNLNGLKSDRAPVLPGGLAIMIAVFEELGVSKMTVAEGALRDGVLYDLMGRHREHDMRETTVSQFCRRYHVDGAQAARVTRQAEHLFRMVSGNALNPDWLKLLLWAARLHEIGLSIAHTAYHKHSAYILQNADMPGFSRREQTLLANVVLGHRGDVGKLLPCLDDLAQWQAIIALRLAVLFYRSRHDVEMPATLQLTAIPNGYSLTIDGEWLKSSPLTSSALRQEVSQWKNIGYVLQLNRV